MVGPGRVGHQDEGLGARLGEVELQGVVVELLDRDGFTDQEEVVAGVAADLVVGVDLPGGDPVVGGDGLTVAELHALADLDHEALVVVADHGALAAM